MTDYAEHVERMRALVRLVSEYAHDRRYDDAYETLREIEGCCWHVRHALAQLRMQERANEQ